MVATAAMTRAAPMISNSERWLLGISVCTIQPVAMGMSRPSNAMASPISPIMMRSRRMPLRLKRTISRVETGSSPNLA